MNHRGAVEHCHLFRAPSQAHKKVVRRLIDEVMNGGRLDVIDELYDPALAPAAKRWIAPFRASFPDRRMEIAHAPACDSRISR